MMARRYTVAATPTHKGHQSLITYFWIQRNATSAPPARDIIRMKRFENTGRVRPSSKEAHAAGKKSMPKSVNGSPNRRYLCVSAQAEVPHTSSCDMTESTSPVMKAALMR